MTLTNLCGKIFTLLEDRISSITHPNEPSSMTAARKSQQKRHRQIIREIKGFLIKRKWFHRQFSPIKLWIQYRNRSLCLSKTVFAFGVRIMCPGANYKCRVLRRASFVPTWISAHALGYFPSLPGHTYRPLTLHHKTLTVGSGQLKTPSLLLQALKKQDFVYLWLVTPSS